MWMDSFHPLQHLNHTSDSPDLLLARQGQTEVSKLNKQIHTIPLSAPKTLVISEFPTKPMLHTCSIASVLSRMQQPKQCWHSTSYILTRAQPQVNSVQGCSQGGRTDPRSQVSSDNIFLRAISTQSTDPSSTGRAVINVPVPRHATKNLGLSSTDI